MVTVLFSFVTNKLLKVLVSKLAILWVYDVSFTPIATLVVHRLLLNLMEVLRVKLESSHLLSMRQVMTLILEKVIIMFFVRCIVQHFGHSGDCEILRIVLRQLVGTCWILAPILLLVGECFIFRVLGLFCILLLLLVAFVVIVIIIVEIVFIVVVLIIVVFTIVILILRVIHGLLAMLLMLRLTLLSAMARIMGTRRATTLASMTAASMLGTNWLSRLLGRVRIRALLLMMTSNQVLRKLNIELHISTFKVLRCWHPELELVINIKINVVGRRSCSWHHGSE